MANQCLLQAYLHKYPLLGTTVVPWLSMEQSTAGDVIHMVKYRINQRESLPKSQWGTVIVALSTILELLFVGATIVILKVPRQMRDTNKYQRPVIIPVQLRTQATLTAGG